MAQWVRGIYTTSAEALGLVSSTDMRVFTTADNQLCFQGIQHSLLASVDTYTHVHTPPHRHRHIYIIKIKQIFNNNNYIELSIFTSYFKVSIRKYILSSTTFSIKKVHILLNFDHLVHKWDV